MLVAASCWKIVHARVVVNSSCCQGGIGNEMFAIEKSGLKCSAKIFPDLIGSEQFNQSFSPVSFMSQKRRFGLVWF